MSVWAIGCPYDAQTANTLGIDPIKVSVSISLKYHIIPRVLVSTPYLFILYGAQPTFWVSVNPVLDIIARMII